MGVGRLHILGEHTVSIPGQYTADLLYLVRSPLVAVYGIRLPPTPTTPKPGANSTPLCLNAPPESEGVPQRL